MQLAPSRYNHVVPRGDRWVGYNARTGVFAALSAEAARLLQTHDGVPLTPLAQDLMDMGFLHDGHEIDQVVSTYTGGRVTTGDLGVTIAPSLDCNKACPYCFQNAYRSSRMMSPETQDATVDYIRARVLAGWTRVSLTWYGGEPLLAADIVVDLTQRLRAAVSEAGGTLNDLAIVTNGVLLDAAMVDRLLGVGVTAAQISFDNLVETSRETRGLIDEEGHPSAILRNATAAASRMHLSIRINVSRANRPDLTRMLEILGEHGLDRIVNLARTDDLDGEAGFVTQPSGQRVKPLPEDGGRAERIRPDPDTLGRASFAKVESEYFDIMPGALQGLVRKLTPRTHFCGATQGSMFAIDPAGDISRCWESVGVPSEAMGNVCQRESDMSETEVAGKWARMSPFLYPSCAGCRVLPLCMGGCSHPRVFMDETKSPCEAIKFQIDEAVSRVARIIQLPAE